jgi:hypothetical protein
VIARILVYPLRVKAQVNLTEGKPILMSLVVVAVVVVVVAVDDDDDDDDDESNETNNVDLE